MTDRYYEDARAFSNLLRKTELQNNMVSFGNFQLGFKNAVDTKIKYSDYDMLECSHQYIFEIYRGTLEVSLRLYLNVKNHYRLFCITKMNNIADAEGMAFSLNLTTQKDSGNTIFLVQKIAFKEQCSADKKVAVEIRRQKQLLLCQVLRKIGVDVTENNDVILGVFDPETQTLLNTTPKLFLNNFLAISIIKRAFSRKQRV